MTRELSPREKDIAALILKKYSNNEIAAALKLSPKAIKTRIRHIYTKLGISGQPKPRKLIKDIYTLSTFIIKISGR